MPHTKRQRAMYTTAHSKIVKKNFHKAPHWDII